MRQQLLHLSTNLRFGAIENRGSVLTRGVVQFLDLPPALRRQGFTSLGIDGGWYYDADGEGLYTPLSPLLNLRRDHPEVCTVPDRSPPSSEDDQTSETTQLLRAWADGDSGALEQLTPRVYRTLRRIAGYQMQNERTGNSMQATALVHEAYLQLIDVNNVSWQHRAHFFAVSAQIMRHILLDRARRRVAAKRGGTAERVNLDELPDLSGNRARELIALEDALNALTANDPRKARVVELRFFGGLSVDETAEVLSVSPETVMRDWKFARSWLHAQLSNS
jgi:RNA polymerase sigma factor (TIGR02999 family)